ncbi:polysaccharide pyruvyl transferase family protein [Phocaeicola sp.]
MNKSIGILTLISADNCGSLLQAYALRYALKEICKSNAELINFWPLQARKLYRTFHPSVIKHPYSLWCTIKYWRRLKKQSISYELFRKKHLQLSGEKLLNRRALNQNLLQYDAIIVGSDQVWNVRMFDFDAAYFLLDYEGHKYSYAASLGGNEKKEVPQVLLSFKDAIQSFDKVSIRETQGKQILSTFCNKEIEVCIDPTLIIPTEEWEHLGGERLVKEDYIFYYSYNYADTVLCSLVQSCARTLHLPVYVINASRWIHHQPSRYGFHLTEQGGPMAFLSLMKHAKYVFVQSLHGAIFASIFQRNYWFLNNRDTDVIDLRSENILELLGTRKRVLRPNNFETVDLTALCTYSKNELLDQEREKSIAYLQNIVNNL